MFVLVSLYGKSDVSEVSHDDFVGIYTTKEDCQKAIIEDVHDLMDGYDLEEVIEYAIIEFEPSQIKYGTVKKTLVFDVDF